MNKRIAMSPTEFPGFPPQADQSESLEALNSMAAVFGEVSRDPQGALTRPIGQWQPWLEEEGYSSEGFDRLFLSITPQEHQSQNIDILNSVYCQAKEENQTTLDFMLTLNHQRPDLLSRCLAELTKHLASLEDTKSFAGGKLTGPAATFIKKHPYHSVELAFGGAALIWLTVEKILELKEKPVKAVETNAIKTTVDDTDAQQVLRLSNKVENGNLDPELIEANIEHHPVQFIEDESVKVDKLKGELLTPENIDKFVTTAMKDEAGALISDEERLLLKEVKYARAGKEWFNNNKLATLHWNLALNQVRNNTQKLLQNKDKLSKMINETPYSGQLKLTPEQLKEVDKETRETIAELTNSLESNLKWIYAGKFDIFKYDFRIYVENCPPGQLDEAAATLAINDLKNSTSIEINYNKARLYFMAELEKDKAIVINDIVDDTEKQAFAWIKGLESEMSNEALEYILNMIENGKQAIDNYFINKI